MARNRGDQRSFDWIIFSLYLSLAGLGVLMVYSVGQRETEMLGFFSSIAGKQVIWAVIAVFLFLVIFLVDWKVWQTLAYPIYGVTLLLLGAVLLFGREIKGATSWFSFGGYSLQPSELAKFGTALALASYLGGFNTNLRLGRTQLTAMALFLLPVALVLLQPDAGSALVFLSFFVALYREGLNPGYYLIAGGVIATTLLGLVLPGAMVAAIFLAIAALFLGYGSGLPFSWGAGALFWIVVTVVLLREEFVQAALFANMILAGVAGTYLVLKKGFRPVVATGMVLGAALGISLTAGFAFHNVLRPHQRERINVWLQPSKSDPRGALYNVLQSKMAISSGGIQGKGFLNGEITRLNYVPEQATDFIFCTIGEEHGFIGSATTIILFLVLLYRMVLLAERQRSNFSRVYAYGVAGVLFVHFFVNIGMTMGIMPIIGIPLPMLSKGGSSLLGFTLLIGVMLKLDSHRYQI